MKEIELIELCTFCYELKKIVKQHHIIGGGFVYVSVKDTQVEGVYCDSIRIYDTSIYREVKSA